MLDGLRFQWKLRSLRAERRKIRRDSDERLKKAKPAKVPRDELNVMYADEKHDLDDVDDQISALLSRRLLALAEDNLIPTPAFDTESETWVRSEITGRFRLSDSAAMELRATIRKEQREQSDLVFRWLAGLTGLIGGLSVRPETLRVI